ncbi:hypothetical protein J6590_101161 [Homalodisca vitripennis]|nr:hypothetical protein J6590_101161 [Homalodisca vitripennis]
MLKMHHLPSERARIISEVVHTRRYAISHSLEACHCAPGCTVCLVMLPDKSIGGASKRGIFEINQAIIISRKDNVFKIEISRDTGKAVCEVRNISIAQLFVELLPVVDQSRHLQDEYTPDCFLMSIPSSQQHSCLILTHVVATV